LPGRGITGIKGLFPFCGLAFPPPSDGGDLLLTSPPPLSLSPLSSHHHQPPKKNDTQNTNPNKVVLTKSVPNLGDAGALVTVPLGHFRNLLRPSGLATPATAGALRNIEAAKQAELARLGEIKAKAQAMATALATIGKFVIKKKTAPDGDEIFGSVSVAEVVAAVEQQTGKVLDKRAVTLPEIKTVGTFDATVKLHPEVVGAFKVVVQREKNA